MLMALQRLESLDLWLETNRPKTAMLEMKKPDLFTMVHIKEELQELFGKPVDIVRLRNNMNPMLLKQIKRDGIYA